ncbi:RNA polymerase sigma factor SigF [Geodermatophilus sp. DSM 44513]|uniref:RNA polymerase sigma factor SigF n=1 Tax=Geodermatophilus sp. DSM 44513 TaxID=1528104 RepID=UPI001271A1AD|nr:RNA polymerase sigma factor SigF [Geodermatophilus sp. DSM 44513]WNV73835.1 RNA polymerase sigma factor SigF [Geodermatophilus sp. DSM 44513]
MTGAASPEPQTVEEDTLRDDEFAAGRRGEGEVASEGVPVVVPDPRSETVPAPDAGAPLGRATADGPDGTGDDETADDAATDGETADSETADADPADGDAADGGTPGAAPVSENRRRAERTAPLFAELAGLEKDDPRRERLREVLVEEHLPLVRHFARRFSNRGEPFDDLLQVGTLGLIAAIDRFDPNRGVEFLSFAVPTITGEIKRHFRDQGWSVRVPRRLQELHLSLNAAVGELAQKNGRAPTPSELAEHLGIPRAEVLEGLAVANAYRSSSLDERLSGEDDSPTLAATLGEEDAALEGVEYRESLQPLLATIPARERRILILRFFGNMTQSQIAADIGISQMHVSRLLSQTLAKLREGLLKD